MAVDPTKLRRFDQNLLEASGRLEHRVSEPVPFCWMCDAISGKRAKEHVFPTWLVEHCGAQQERCQPYRISLALGGAVASQRNDMPVGSVLAGEVCATCNSGWMNQLEEAVRPILKAERRRGRIENDEAFTLARWFTKTAICLNVSMPFRLLFDSKTRHAVASGMPTNVVVGLYRVRITDGSFDWAQSCVTHAVAPSDDVDGDQLRRIMAMAYVGRIRVQRLVGAVVVLPEPIRAEHVDAQIARIWPLPARLPTWGALPMVNHYSEPLVGLHLPPDWNLGT